MEEREEKIFEDLCPELMEVVLSRVPLITRTRLKCVSKSWRHVITCLRHSSPQMTSSGLVIFSKNVEPNVHQSSLIEVLDHQDCNLYDSFRHNFPWLVDSCNGLLLYANKENNNWTYCISSPLLNQWSILPQRPKSWILARETLAFDGHNPFKIICFSSQEVDFSAGKVSCQIFLSQTWKWKEVELTLLNSNLLLEGECCYMDWFGPSVYSSGRLYWAWCSSMLVFYEDSELFKLVRLPKSKTTKKCTKYPLYLRLWASEGRIHYCEATQEGYCIWIYLNDDDDDEYEWQAKRSIMLDRSIEVVLWVNKTMKARVGEGMIQPCAFNEDLQVLYFQVPPGSIVSYSFETQKMEKVWDYGKPGEDYFMSHVFPFLFNSVNLVSKDMSN